MAGCSKSGGRRRRGTLPSGETTWTVDAAEWKNYSGLRHDVVNGVAETEGVTKYDAGEAAADQKEQKGSTTMKS